MKQQTTSNKQLAMCLCTMLSFLIGNLINAQVFYTEDFETDGNGTRYFPEVESIDAINDYFSRTDGSTISANAGNDYSGLSGSFYWAGEDHDDSGVGGSGNSELELEIRDVNIVGKTDLSFSALFGGKADTVYESIDDANPDYVIVEYRINNGAWLVGISFQSTSTNTFGGFLSVDTDGDNRGDGFVLNTNMESLSFSIPETGNEIDIRLRASSRSSSEEWAIDLIQISENSTLSTPNVLNESDVRIYETSVSGILQVETPYNANIQAIEVYDLTGKQISIATTVVNSNNCKINLSKSQPGIYILKIKSNSGSVSKKIVVQ